MKQRGRDKGWAEGSDRERDILYVQTGVNAEKPQKIRMRVMITNANQVE